MKLHKYRSIKQNVQKQNNVNMGLILTLDATD